MTIDFIMVADGKCIFPDQYLEKGVTYTYMLKALNTAGVVLGISDQVSL